MFNRQFSVILFAQNRVTKNMKKLIIIFSVFALFAISCNQPTRKQTETAVETYTLYIQQEVVQEKTQELKQKEVSLDTILQIIPPPPPPKLRMLPPAGYSLRNIDGLWTFFGRRGWGFATYTKLSGQWRLECGNCFSLGRTWGIAGKGQFVNGLMHGRWRLISCVSGNRHEVNFNNGLVLGRYRLMNMRDSVLYETYFERATMIHEVRHLYNVFTRYRDCTNLPRDLFELE